MVALITAASLLVSGALLTLLWQVWRWRSASPVETEDTTRFRGRIVAASDATADGGVVVQRAASGEFLEARSFVVQAQATRVTVDPTEASLDVYPRWGRGEDLRLGDTVELVGAWGEGALVRASSITRGGWPRVGLVGLCVAVIAIVGLAVGVQQLLGPETSGCPAGTEPHRRVFPTGVEHSCRRAGTRHGPMRIENHVGRVVSKGHYREGIQHGTFWRYHRNGKPAERLDYAQGKRHGLWRKWHFDGTKVLEGRFEAGVGQVRGLHRDGKRAEEGGYLGDQRHGSWRYWRSDGTVHSEGPYQRGKKHGLWTAFQDDGETRQYRGRYAAGKKVGPWTWWDDKGKREKRGEFAKGKKHGPWSWWHKNGKLARRGAFAKGKKDGAWIFEDDEGRRQIEGSYREGRRVGSWRWFCEACEDCDPCDGKGGKTVVDKVYDEPASKAARPEVKVQSSAGRSR